MNKSKKFLTIIIAILLLIIAGVLSRSEISTIIKETYARTHFDSSKGNKLTPEGYAPEVVGDSYKSDNTSQGEL